MTLPPIPEKGLSEVLSKWIGRGGLYQALAAPADVAAEIRWSGADIEARAHRVLLERLKPLIVRLPQRAGDWINLLPASQVREAFVEAMPSAGTAWADTRVRFGWPPSEFAARRSKRGADTLLATSLSWTLAKLEQVRGGAIKSSADADLNMRTQLDAAGRAMQLEPLASTPALRPGNHDLLSLRRSGRPWSTVAEIARGLGLLDGSPEVLTEALLAPDDEIRWRLFHLAVLGVLLNALRANGCSITSLRPLGGGSKGPAFIVEAPQGRTFDLWFEAAGIWQATGIRPPYAEATAGLPLRERALGADLLLIGQGLPALAIECKYSNNPEFVARNGFYQAAAYSLELSSRLVPTVVAVTVGPEGVVGRTSFCTLRSGQVGSCSPAGLPSVVEAFLSGREIEDTPGRQEASSGDRPVGHAH